MVDLGKAHRDEFLHEHFRQGLIDWEVQRALGHRVAVKLTGQLPQNRAAEWQIAQMAPKSGKAGNGLTAHPKCGNAIRDHLLCFGNDLEDRAAKRLKRAAFRLLDAAQIFINVPGGHRRPVYCRRIRQAPIFQDSLAIGR